MLGLFGFLSRYDHEYALYYDGAHGAYGDLTFEEAISHVQAGVDFLLAKKVEYILVPPVYELALLADKKNKTTTKILPLFTEYVMKEGFAHSLVGKIGMIGDHADIEMGQTLLSQLVTKYSLSDAQKAIRKFQFPFVYRAKEVALWKYFAMKLSYANMMVNKIIKFDLRYFKDAMVDTVIPFNYAYFHYQNTISKFFNFKKIRFHKIEKLEDRWKVLASSFTLQASSYTLQVYHTSHVDFLKEEKRVMRLLQRGKTVDISFESIK